VEQGLLPQTCSVYSLGLNSSEGKKPYELPPSFLEVFPELECRKKAAEYVWRLRTSCTVVFCNGEAVVLLL